MHKIKRIGFRWMVSGITINVYIQVKVYHGAGGRGQPDGGEAPGWARAGGGMAKCPAATKGGSLMDI